MVVYEKKIKYVDYFKGLGLRTNFFSRAHVLTKMESSISGQFQQKYVISVLYSGMADEKSIDAINEWSYQFIK